MLCWRFLFSLQFEEAPIAADYLKSEAIQDRYAIMGQIYPLEANCPISFYETVRLSQALKSSLATVFQLYLLHLLLLPSFFWPPSCSFYNYFLFLHLALSTKYNIHKPIPTRNNRYKGKKSAIHSTFFTIHVKYNVKQHK